MRKRKACNANLKLQNSLISPTATYKETPANFQTLQLCNIPQHYDQRLRGSSCIIPCPFSAPAREPCAPAEANKQGQLASSGCMHANKPPGHYKWEPTEETQAFSHKRE